MTRQRPISPACEPFFGIQLNTLLQPPPPVPSWLPLAPCELVILEKYTNKASLPINDMDPEKNLKVANFLMMVSYCLVEQVIENDESNRKVDRAHQLMFDALYQLSTETADRLEQEEIAGHQLEDAAETIIENYSDLMTAYGL